MKCGIWLGFSKKIYQYLIAVTGVIHGMGPREKF